MIQGDLKENKDIKAYRKIPRLSYSSLKLYIENRKRFYKEEILGEKKEKKSNDSMRMGNLVDVLLTDKEHFDDYFYIAGCSKPTGQLLTFTEALFELVADGEIKSDSFSVAYEKVKEGNGGKLRDSLDKFIENFKNKGKDYFKELVLSQNKEVVTTEEIIMAESIVKALQDSFNTRDIVRAEGDHVYTKFPILFTYRGRELKCEVDKMIRNDKEKTIEIYDYKCTAFVESFLSTYLEEKYYLQQALYRVAVLEWKKVNYPDYTVKYMAFIAGDSINYYSPLIIQMNSDNYEQGLGGFTVNGRRYKGVNEILDDIRLSEETDMWNMSADNIRTKGIVTIPTFNK